jgi:hypothetical protein
MPRIRLFLFFLCLGLGLVPTAFSHNHKHPTPYTDTDSSPHPNSDAHTYPNSDTDSNSDSGDYLGLGPSPATNDPSTNPVGYHLHVGFTAGRETQTIDEHNVTTATYIGTAGTLYFFTVTAYNMAGVDSLPSKEVSGIAP